MFSKLKEKVKELAQTAVFMAEDVLGSKKGQMKKEMALNYISAHIPIPAVIKPLIIKLLSGFIDETVEFAVSYMQKLNTTTETGETIDDEL